LIPGLRRRPFKGSFGPLESATPYTPVNRGDGLLWAIAFAASIIVGMLLVVVIVAFLFVAEITSRIFPKDPETVAAEAKPEMVTMTPDMLQVIPSKSSGAAAPTPALPPRALPPEAVRTSEEQRGKRPDKPAFIGERDTQATSDATPDPTAKPLPSQRGREQRDENDIETTESKYQDGPLPDMNRSSTAEATPPAPTLPATPSFPQLPPVPESPPAENAQAATAPPASEKAAMGEKASPKVPKSADLVQGPNPVDVPVPKPKPEEAPPPTQGASPGEKTAKASPQQKPPAPAKPATKYDDPAFRGNQSKTAIRGSISRNGRSALDVADTPLGRYQALISRAVEQEWQRNCVRYRDNITPGFLTVRFFIEPSGKVKKVQFVGEMQTGEIQKGFTLNSIRDAEIPAMPAALKAEFSDAPLELIFNFYF
jgi:hypothetical protein